MNQKPIHHREAKPNKSKTMTAQEKKFLTYVWTQQFLKTRLRGIDETIAVHVNQKMIETVFFPYPECNRNDSLKRLVSDGELIILDGKAPNGRYMKLYSAIKPREIDLSLVKPKPITWTPGLAALRDYLMRVSLPKRVAATPYFEAFIKHRNNYFDLFFTVDDFAGRIHTPVSGLSRHIRPSLLIDGEPTASFDVATMQPLLLGRILKQEIGDNQFSRWIDDGIDIYSMLQEKLKLSTRDEGKRIFFNIFASYVFMQTNDFFGESDWMRWINEYKRNPQLLNPHGNRTHTNISWLLQRSEVELMKKVWRKLINADIPLLTVHDEVIVKERQAHQAEGIFRSVLSQEFPFYRLNSK